MFKVDFSPDKPTKNLAGILEQSMGARNRAEIGLSYRPVRLYRLAESISVLLNVVKYRLCTPSHADALDVHTRENQREVEIMSYLYSHCEGHRFTETLYRSL